MKNKIIVLILLIIVVIIVLLYMMNSSKNQTSPIPNEDDIVNQDNRTIFNTNTQTDITPVSNQLPQPEGEEERIVNNLNKSFSNWKITKDPETLKEIVDATGGADNEVLYEPWISFFAENNSGELMKLVNTSTNKKDTAQKVFYIYEWFIYGSGEYEKLSLPRRQTLSGQFTELKNILGIK